MLDDEDEDEDEDEDDEDDDDDDDDDDVSFMLRWPLGFIWVLFFREVTFSQTWIRNMLAKCRTFGSWTGFQRSITNQFGIHFRGSGVQQEMPTFW